MRRLILIIPFSVLAVLACGPVDTGQGSSGNSADGGPIWSAGGNGPDAGIPGADGGTAGGGPAATSCDGVVPTESPPARSAVVPHGSGEVCFYATTDESGTVAVDAQTGSGDPRWQLYAPDGTPSGTFTNGTDLYAQQSGFEGTSRDKGSTYLVRWSGTGVEQTRTLLGGNGCQGVSFRSMVRGTLTLGGCGGGPLTATLFDTAGKPTVSKAVADKLAEASGFVDTNGRTLVVLNGGSAVGVSSKYAGRWFDTSLNPSTPWFSLPGDGEGVLIRPLIGGALALQIASNWVAKLSGGSAGWDAPPEFLSSHPLHDAIIVRGGRAYALVPKYGASTPRNQLDLYAPDGQRCGSGIFQAEGLAVGIEGTVLGAGGEGGCNLTFWPGALR